MSIDLKLKMQRPHIVILGAGASRAVCPEDRNGKKLPIMFQKCIAASAQVI